MKISEEEGEMGRGGRGANFYFTGLKSRICSCFLHIAMQERVCVNSGGRRKNTNTVIEKYFMTSKSPAFIEVKVPQGTIII